MTALATEYLTLFVLAGVAATTGTVLFGLYRVARRAALSPPGRGVAFRLAAILFLAWLAASLAAAWLGFYQAGFQAPTIQYGLLLPILAGVLLYRQWPALRAIVHAAPNSWIVGVQVYRVLGVIFLALYAAGRMPGVFAKPAGAGDVVVGLAAPLVAVTYARGRRGSKGLVRAWNLLGVADLAVAVTTGFLSSPSKFQLLAFDRPNVLVGQFPLVMIPVFLVPLAILLHLASLSRLKETARASGTPFGRQVAAV